MKKAQPIMLMDASFLIQLGQAENAINYEMNSDYDALSQPQLIDILDRFTRDGRTIMLTRKVMSEIFPTASGRLDYELQEQGKLGFPLALSHEQCRYPETMLSHNLFTHFAQKGQLRCYESVDAMLDAGEVTAPRGGIVVVDTAPAEKRRPPQPDGMRLSPNRDYFDVVLKAHEIAERTARAVAKHHNRGDNTLVNLGIAIERNAREHGQNGSFLVATNDNDLMARFRNMTHRNFAPVVCRPYELLYAMEMERRPDGNTLEEGVAARYTNAVQHVKERSGYRMNINQDKFMQAVERTRYWLQHSREDAATAAAGLGEHTARLNGSRSLDAGVQL